MGRESVGSGRYRGDMSVGMEALERQTTASDPSRAVKFSDVTQRAARTGAGLAVSEGRGGEGLCVAWAWGERRGMRMDGAAERCERFPTMPR